VSPTTREWSDEELHEALKAYLWMLRQETDNRPYSKADVNRSLREGPLKNRSKSSIEYRMQNISAALEELCLPRIQGYVPAKNLGVNVRDKIWNFLIEEGVYLSE
jgi:5-methylcytosine-specific restriction enzyme A